MLLNLQLDLKRELRKILKERKEIMNSCVGNYVTSYDEVKYFNISMGALGLIGKDSQEFFRLIEHLTNKQTANYIVNKMHMINLLFVLL